MKRDDLIEFAQGYYRDQRYLRKAADTYIRAFDNRAASLSVGALFVDDALVADAVNYIRMCSRAAEERVTEMLRKANRSGAK